MNFKAREPNLPVRKKVPRDEEHNDDNNNENEDDFIILGDQSKFRLDMIPYRARSLSAPVSGITACSFTNYNVECLLLLLRWLKIAYKLFRDLI